MKSAKHRSIFHISWRLRFGDFDLTNKADDIHVTERNIKDIVIHSKYDNFKAYHDVALVKMIPVNFTTSIRPICLPIDLANFNSNNEGSKISK